MDKNSKKKNEKLVGLIIFIFVLINLLPAILKLAPNSYKNDFNNIISIIPIIIIFFVIFSIIKQFSSIIDGSTFLNHINKVKDEMNQKHNSTTSSSTNNNSNLDDFVSPNNPNQITKANNNHIPSQSIPQYKSSQVNNHFPNNNKLKSPDIIRTTLFIFAIVGLVTYLVIYFIIQ